MVRRLAIETYMVNGSASSASGAGAFAENVNTVQTANEYANIAEGDLTKAWTSSTRPNTTNRDSSRH